MEYDIYPSVYKAFVIPLFLSKVHLYAYSQTNNKFRHCIVKCMVMW